MHRTVVLGSHYTVTVSKQKDRDARRFPAPPACVGKLLQIAEAKRSRTAIAIAIAEQKRRKKLPQLLLSRATGCAAAISNKKTSWRMPGRGNYPLPPPVLRVMLPLSPALLRLRCSVARRMERPRRWRAVRGLLRRCYAEVLPLEAFVRRLQVGSGAEDELEPLVQAGDPKCYRGLVDQCVVGLPAGGKSLPPRFTFQQVGRRAGCLLGLLPACMRLLNKLTYSLVVLRKICPVVRIACYSSLERERMACKLIQGVYSIYEMKTR